MTAAAPFQCYRAYGLCIRSQVPLPELAPDAAEGGGDLTIRLHSGAAPLPARISELPPGTRYRLLEWESAGRFLIIDADQIEVEAAPGAVPALLALPLLGPVMALVLHLRGLFVLHGSAVDVGGAAVAFIGDKGAGKSTAAAAMLRAGHRLLADDVLALAGVEAGAPIAIPAFPQLKLAHDADAQLAPAQAEALPDPTPDFPKRQHRLSSGFAHSPTPLARVYVLDSAPELATAAIEGAASISALMACAYVAMFAEHDWTKIEMKTLFTRCGALARGGRVRRLYVPRGLERLDALPGFVAADLAQ